MISTTNTDAGATAGGNPPIGVKDVQRRVADAAFGRPLITNVLRGQVAEAIIAYALEPEWHWCAADYSSWDFEHRDGLRLEVKQSAARQSWSTSAKPSAASFDIAARKQRWENDAWVQEPGRAAQLYILAHHPETGDDADHRDPAQWQFYVVRACDLPDTQRISLAGVQRLSTPLQFSELAKAVDKSARSLTEN